jgi:hypothetical protein
MLNNKVYITHLGNYSHTVSMSSVVGIFSNLNDAVKKLLTLLYTNKNNPNRFINNRWEYGSTDNIDLLSLFTDHHH